MNFLKSESHAGFLYMYEEDATCLSIFARAYNLSSLMKINQEPNICTPIFTAVLFIVAKVLKPPKCPPVD